MINGSNSHKTRSSGGRDIEWYFHYRPAADAAQDLFRQVPDCARIKIYYCRIQRAFPTRMRESNDQFANIDNPYDFARVIPSTRPGARASRRSDCTSLPRLHRPSEAGPSRLCNWIFNLKGKPKKFQCLARDARGGDSPPCRPGRRWRSDANLWHRANCS